MGIEYDSFCMKTYSKYRLPLVTASDNVYSGFNMGAGENALFEIFSTIYASPPGTMLVIDEIELGLHESAQKKLINELKKISRERHIQVICTTHSSAILASVPPEGRFFVESYPGKTTIIPGISPKYAAGKLAGEKSNELDIYVEDGMAVQLIRACLTSDIRKRTNIIPIGSSISVIRQLAGRYKDKRRSECIAILDGDKSRFKDQHIRQFIIALESSKDSDDELEWINDRLIFLPGDTWPEKWIIQQLNKLEVDSLAYSFNTTKEELCSCIDKSLIAEKHNEIFILANELSLETDNVCFTVCRWIAEKITNDFLLINKAIISKLP